MRIINIKNPTPLNSPFTIVSTDYTSGTTLLVEDSSNFVAGGLILVGGQGNEKAETTNLTAGAPNSNSLTITALDHPHSSDESVQTVPWDTFNISYSSDGGDTWIDLTDGDIKFDWSVNETSYIQIYNAFGQKILSVKIHSQETISIPFSSYTKGFYFMKVMNKNKNNRIYKIIKL